MSWGRDERVDDVYFENLTSEGDPTEEGQTRRVNDDLVVFIDGQVKSLTASSSGITETQHEDLDTLVHELSESFYEEHAYSIGNLTNITVWTDATKTTKVRETQYTYSGWHITQEVVIQYNASGVEVQRMTYTYAYSGWRVISITAVETP